VGYFQKQIVSAGAAMPVRWMRSVGMMLSFFWLFYFYVSTMHLVEI